MTVLCFVNRPFAKRQTLSIPLTMRKNLLILTLLFLCVETFGQGDENIPTIENFENNNSWPWTPWVNKSNGTSQKVSLSAHTGKFGLRNSSGLMFRSDITIGTKGQIISWWIRFEGPSRVYCGFGADAFKAFYLCVDPGTSTLHFANSPDYTHPLLKSFRQSYRMKVWYRAELTFNTSTNVTAKLYGSNGKTLLNSITVDIPELKPGGLAFRGEGFAHLDDIKGGDLVLQSTTEPLTPKIGERIILKNIFFENEKSTLLPQSYTELDRLVQYLKLNPNKKIEISGHTDNIGSESLNKNLSEARAKSVADYLIRQGIDKTNINYKGFGSLKPIATNITEDGRQKNRRVEFTINTN
jgi:outer membrane protein OmpA-like peptidoglycan-associated protein